MLHLLSENRKSTLVLHLFPPVFSPGLQHMEWGLPQSSSSTKMEALAPFHTQTAMSKAKHLPNGL